MSAIASSPEPPRNARCPCGSGKRYKDCHGAIQPPVAGSLAPLLAKARHALAQGDAGQAEAAWREALASDPDQAEALFHLGNLEREHGQHDLAVDHYRRALVRAPGHAGVLNNLGLAYEALGHAAEAEACYREVLAATPSHPDALANLANIQFGREEYAAAAESYTRAFAIRRDAPPWIWVKRGIAQDRIHDMAGAQASFLEAARLAPDDLQIHCNLATQPDGACALCRSRADLAAHARARPGQSVCVVDARALHASSAASGPGSTPCSRRSMPRSPTRRTATDATRSIRFHCWRCRATRRLSCVPRNAGLQRWPRPRPAPRLRPPTPADARLRVGFVSSDLREHPMMHLQLEHWERIDRARIETFGYGLRAIDPGPIGRRAAHAFEHFADVSAESTEQIHRRIRADGIAILFDLNGYTAGGDSRLMGLRPAPIQINSIGFPGTLGADWYDYILVDRFGAPEAMQPFYTERLWHMPHASYPSDTTRAPRGPPPSRAECGLPEQGFVFCCFNKSFKILPDGVRDLDAPAARRARAACCGCSRATPKRPPTCAAKPRRPASIRRA